MQNATLDKLIWGLIYGGLLMLCLGLFVRRQDAAAGLGLVAVGFGAAAVGAALVWVRARRGAQLPQQDT